MRKFYKTPDFDRDDVSREADEAIRKIDQLLDSDLFDWAMDTLKGIRENVKEWRRITSGQKRALERIEASVEKWEAKMAIDRIIKEPFEGHDF